MINVWCLARESRLVRSSTSKSRKFIFCDTATLCQIGRILHVCRETSNVSPSEIHWVCRKQRRLFAAEATELTWNSQGHWNMSNSRPAFWATHEKEKPFDILKSSVLDHSRRIWWTYRRVLFGGDIILSPFQNIRTWSLERRGNDEHVIQGPIRSYLVHSGRLEVKPLNEQSERPTGDSAGFWFCSRLCDPTVHLDVCENNR